MRWIVSWQWEKLWELWSEDGTNSQGHYSLIVVCQGQSQTINGYLSWEDIPPEKAHWNDSNIWINYPDLSSATCMSTEENLQTLVNVNNYSKNFRQLVDRYVNCVHWHIFDNYKKRQRLFYILLASTDTWQYLSWINGLQCERMYMFWHECMKCNHFTSSLKSEILGFLISMMRRCILLLCRKF